MRDLDEDVRKHAVRLGENFLRAGGLADANLLGGLSELASDPSANVRYQLALTLGIITHPDRPRHLAAIYAAGGGDPWVEAAVLKAIGGEAVALFASLYADASPAAVAGRAGSGRNWPG